MERSPEQFAAIRALASNVAPGMVWHGWIEQAGGDVIAETDTTPTVVARIAPDGGVSTPLEARETAGVAMGDDPRRVVEIAREMIGAASGARRAAFEVVGFELLAA